jgi:spore germination protein GerM
MRFIVPSRDPVLLARFIFEELVKGPDGELAATLPPQSAMRAIFIADGSVCYLDLTEAIREAHPGGIQSELFSIYSIVNSLVLNIPQIDAVKFLIEGSEVQTLAGHIDLQLPVKANMLLIR